MSDIAKKLRECAAQIRRTPIRLDTWIPLQQRAADEIERLELEVFAKDNAIANLGSLVDELRAEVEAPRAFLRKLEQWRGPHHTDCECWSCEARRLLAREGK